jgi:hypothetical protein
MISKKWLRHWAFLYSCLLIGMGTLTNDLLAASPGSGNAWLSFTAAGPGEFQFNTGIVQGRLGSRDKAMGLSSVIYSPSSTSLDRSMGLCSFYRVFTRNHRYGTAAWDWPGQYRLLENGTVQIQWPATDDRPFILSAVYRWLDPVTLEVSTTVTAQQDLPDFEVFLASYFQPAFSNALVCVKDDSSPRGPVKFVEASEARGAWQMTPRDASVIPLIQDGRWKLEPNPVDWKILPALGYPLTVRRAQTVPLTAVLMAPTNDCFAIAMPQQTEGHYSVYLSLFGRTVSKGQTAQARTWLMLLQGVHGESLIDLYRRRTATP